MSADGKPNKHCLVSVWGGKKTLIGLPAVSALCMVLPYPSFDLGIFAWFGMAPFLFVLRQRGLMAAAAMGFLFGTVWGVGLFYWINGIVPTNASKILLVFFQCSLFYSLFGLFYRLGSSQSNSFMIIAGPALMVAMEYLKSNIGFASMPWNLLGHSQYQNIPVIQISALTGTYGVSFILVMVNQAISRLPNFIGYASGKFRQIGQVLPKTFAFEFAAVTVAIIFVFSYGYTKASKAPAGRQLRVALVQANLVTTEKMAEELQREHLETYAQLTRIAAREKPEIIVWPTSSLPGPLKMSPLVQKVVFNLARETQSYLVVGGAGYEKNKPKKDGYLPFSNSEFLISPLGQIEAQYNKMRLLPFNEYIPCQGKFSWPGWITTLSSSFTAGESYTLFHVSGTSFGTPICWENMFSAHFRRFVKNGADFMVSVTNEGFYGRTAAPYQTLAINVFRAVENRVAIARCATTGISCFISSNGEIGERIKNREGDDLFVSGILVKDVPLSDTKTFYTRYGDVFAYAAIGVALIWLLVSLSFRWLSFTDKRK